MGTIGKPVQGRACAQAALPRATPVAKKRQQAWSSYWQGSHAGDGEALQGNAHADLCRLYWRGVVSRGLHRGGRVSVLDLACGNAVVSRMVLDRVAEAAIDAVVVGIDYAIPALQHFQSSNGRAKSCPAAGDARALPFPDGRFDWVLSQFGLEYAGPAAFAETARVLAPGGRFQALVHMKSGGLWRENSDNLALLNTVRLHRLLPRFLRLVESGADGDPAAARSRTRRRHAAAFQTAAQSVVGVLDATPPCAAKSHIQRMLPDLVDIAARRRNFDAAELVAWARQQQDALAAYEFRLQSMVDAAMDEPGLRRALAPFATASQIDVAPFHTLDKQHAAAWSVAVAGAGR